MASVVSPSAERQVSWREWGHYKIATAFCQKIYDLSHYNRIKIDRPNLPPIFVGRQPDETLMAALSLEHGIGLEEIHSVSVLENWEHVNTRGILPENLHQIEAIDNMGMSPSQIQQGVNLIKELVDAKRPLYIHCKSGVGRSATVLARLS